MGVTKQICGSGMVFGEYTKSNGPGTVQRDLKQFVCKLEIQTIQAGIEKLMKPYVPPYGKCLTDVKEPYKAVNSQAREVTNLYKYYS